MGYQDRHDRTEVRHGGTACAEICRVIGSDSGSSGWLTVLPHEQFACTHWPVHMSWRLCASAVDGLGRSSCELAD